MHLHFTSCAVSIDRALCVHMNLCVHVRAWGRRPATPCVNVRRLKHQGGLRTHSVIASVDRSRPGPDRHRHVRPVGRAVAPSLHVQARPSGTRGDPAPSIDPPVSAAPCRAVLLLPGDRTPGTEMDAWMDGRLAAECMICEDHDYEPAKRDGDLRNSDLYI